MGNLREQVRAWRQCSSLQDALLLVDIGVILERPDVKKVMRELGDKQCADLVRHFAVRLAERHDNRLASECAIDSLMGLLSAAADENLLTAFLETYLEQPDCSRSGFLFVEIALTNEPDDFELDHHVFAMSVSTVCELGLALHDIEQQYPNQFPKANVLKEHIATYLLSVSNSNSQRIRLSLLNYFGVTRDQVGFNKIIGRFGHTVLEHLFLSLFHKKTEAVALQYLLENMPFILVGDQHAQKIVHEIWKFHMLKKPERFGLFIQALASRLKSIEGPIGTQMRRVFCQHLGALLTVVSELNHKPLAQELILGIVPFRQEAGKGVILQLVDSGDLRPLINELLIALRDEEDDEKVVESASRFVAAKRGRKPSFQQLSGILTVRQVQMLSHQSIAKAS